MVFIAFIWCYKVGNYLDACDKIYSDKKARIQSEKFVQIWIRTHSQHPLKHQNQLDINIDIDFVM